MHWVPQHKFQVLGGRTSVRPENFPTSGKARDVPVALFPVEERTSDRDVPA